MPVYLLCFDKKFRHAKHYIGFVQNMEGLPKRLNHHKKGTGSRLMAAVSKAGIGFHVSRTWPDGDRNFERKLKNRKKSSQLCPHCTSLKKANKLRDKHIAHLKANPPSPAMQAVIKELSTPEGFRAAFDVIKDHDPVVCPVIETAKNMVETAKTYDLQVVDYRESRLLNSQSPTVPDLLAKAKEIMNAQSQSDTDQSRWNRIRIYVSRFWLVLKSKLVSQR